VKFTSASGNSYACNGDNGANGADGSPWTLGGTLPANAPMTGAWDASFAGPETVSSVSFPIPLKAPLDAAHVKPVGAGGPIPEECTDGDAPVPSAANPEADPGYLCVFIVAIEPKGEIAGGGIVDPATFASGAGTTGAALLLNEGEGPGFALGTWAVTGAP
jgi:hypothetical protein